MTIIVPPGGFAGFAQQTPATQALFQRAGRTGGLRSAAKRAKRRKTRAAAAPKRRRKTRAAAPRRARRAKSARMVKGSAAARRHMAKLRRMRKR
jgi:hypothetical protein